MDKIDISWLNLTELEGLAVGKVGGGSGGDDGKNLWG